METLYISGTDCTPKVVFNSNGTLLMSGRSMPEDVRKFYFPLLDWVVNVEMDAIHLDLKFEYLNTSSSKELLELLKCLDSNYKVKEVTINWYYEFDDFDILELGEIYKENLNRVKFCFYEYVEPV